MHYNWSKMVGGVHTSIELPALAGQLATTGLDVKIKKRVYSNGDDYIRILEGDDFTLERVSPDGYHAEGVSSAIERMCAAVSRVSSKLIEINCRHWFEVRDRQSRIIYSVHYFSPNGANRFSESPPRG